MRKKRWTEKQLKEKIEEIKGQVNYQKRTIKRSEDEIRDLEILQRYFREMLAKKYDNPSSVKFGGPQK